MGEWVAEPSANLREGSNSPRVSFPALTMRCPGLGEGRRELPVFLLGEGAPGLALHIAQRPQRERRPGNREVVRRLDEEYGVVPAH
jgi:hypothetical protein